MATSLTLKMLLGHLTCSRPSHFTSAVNIPLICQSGSELSSSGYLAKEAFCTHTHNCCLHSRGVGWLGHADAVVGTKLSATRPMPTPGRAC